MTLDAILTNMILENMAPVEGLRPGALMMKAESKPVLPTPQETVCGCVCVSMIEGWILGVGWSGKFQVEIHKVQERK